MPNALWLEGYETAKASESSARKDFTASAAFKPEHCPKCGSVGHFYKHGVVPLNCVHAPAYGKQVHVKIDAQRYRCRSCGATFNQPLPGVDKSRLMTEKCIEWILERGLTHTFSEVAKDVGVNEKTVRNICSPEFKRRVAARKTPRGAASPAILGIDELMLDGDMRAIFMDIGRSRIVDLIESKRKDFIARWMQANLDLGVIQVVSIDMCNAYRDVARKLMPHATVVADKFHVVRCANRAFDKIRNRARRAAPTAAGRKNPWRKVKLLRTRPHKLDAFAQMDVDGIIANDPLIADAYRTREAFYNVWNASSAAEAETLFRKWENSIPDSVKKEFGGVAKTIRDWHREVFAYFDCGVTNALTENRNSLIKELNRAGRGYSFDIIKAKAVLAPARRGAPTLYPPHFGSLLELR